MLNYSLVLLVPILLALLTHRVTEAHRAPGQAPAPLMPWMLLACALRVGGYYASTQLQLFSHEGGGGDASGYMLHARYIVAIWERSGLHFVDHEEYRPIGRASLPPNLFAWITYLNGDEAREGCAALSMLFTGVTVLNLYALARELGAPQTGALRAALVPLFLPGFVLYSSDVYKDPLVWMLTFGALASSVRLLEKLSLRDVLIAAACAWGLWYVRFYLVFATLAPLAVGLFGLNSKKPVRTLLMLLVGVAVALPIMAYVPELGVLGEDATETFNHSTTSGQLSAQHKGASGVTFDDGGVFYRALPQKLLYTLFSPFPWTAGSMGLHVGKLDAMLWTYVIWRALKGARILYRQRFGPLLALLTFALPTTVVYAFSMYNIGLILRQRMPIVLVGLVLAAISYQAEFATDEADDELDEHDDDEALDEHDDALAGHGAQPPAEPV